jgi:RNA polymerase sigma factor (sigma-70 family)
MNVLESYRTYLEVEARMRRGPALKAREATSDLLQHTALAALQRLKEGDGPRDADEAALREWLRGVMRREVERLRKQLRAGKRDPRRERPLDGQLPDDDAPPDRLAARAEAEARVREALDRLEPHDREVLVERVVEDLTFRALGERRQISAPGAFQAYDRALRRLGRELGDGDAFLS